MPQITRTRFDSDTFGYIQTDVPCGGNCLTFDWVADVRHRHCEVVVSSDPLTDLPLRCNAFVLIEQDGPEPRDIAVDPAHGAICSDCREVVCKDCTERHTPTGKPMCKPCYDDARLALDNARV